MSLYILPYRPRPGVTRFRHGQFVCTEGVLDVLRRDPLTGDGTVSVATVGLCIARHLNCDWGDVCIEDWAENDAALREGNSLLSSYAMAFNIPAVTIERVANEGTASVRLPVGEGTRIWIMTEADRSATTVLLPDEY